MIKHRPSLAESDQSELSRDIRLSKSKKKRSVSALRTPKWSDSNEMEEQFQVSSSEE